MTDHEHDRPSPEEAPDDLDLPSEEADEVVGGKPPAPPGGPVPIPYPN